jgi:CheY-like chemotaxis protein
MILFIDDEKRAMTTYVEELKLSNYDVSFQTSVINALRSLEDGTAAIELVVLDIMMPFGTTFSADETEFGLRTGVRLYERIREHSPACPIVIFTNVTDPSVAERFRDEKNCWFLQKEHYLPFELAERVGEILGPRRH